MFIVCSSRRALRQIAQSRESLKQLYITPDTLALDSNGSVTFLFFLPSTLNNFCGVFTLSLLKISAYTAYVFSKVKRLTL